MKLKTRVFLHTLGSFASAIMKQYVIKLNFVGHRICWIEQMV